ncbi:MAG: DUF134 domain-containing protein [Cellulosilyticum sp.]|nr:DUF134 domain-containing protein [Cellulosilyticum sp.]
MARPVKVRKVENLPKENYFMPKGKKQCTLEEMALKVEELEAMRLKDIEGLSQEECAKQMEVSRQTFQNILDEARRKVTLALVEGRGIRIGGGNFVTKQCRYYCNACEKTYTIRYKQDQEQCPECGGRSVICGKKECGCKGKCKV